MIRKLTPLSNQLRIRVLENSLEMLDKLKIINAIKIRANQCHYMID